MTSARKVEGAEHTRSELLREEWDTITNSRRGQGDGVALSGGTTSVGERVGRRWMGWGVGRGGGREAEGAFAGEQGRGQRTSDEGPRD